MVPLTAASSRNTMHDATRGQMFKSTQALVSAAILVAFLVGTQVEPCVAAGSDGGASRGATDVAGATVPQPLPALAPAGVLRGKFGGDNLNLND